MRVELSGIDGRNLLPYLPAVAVQYALTHQASTEVKRQPVRMNWDTGPFRPTLEFPLTP